MDYIKGQPKDPVTLPKQEDMIMRQEQKVEQRLRRSAEENRYLIEAMMDNPDFLARVKEDV